MNETSAPMGHREHSQGESTLRILAVDDDCNEFLLLEESLNASCAKVKLDTATTGHLAIITLLTSNPDNLPHLALVDIGLPLISGFDLAQQFIEHGIPTVMMSVLVTPDRSEKARQLGALDLLQKPKDTPGYNRLAARVIELARKHATVQ